MEKLELSVEVCRVQEEFINLSDECFMITDKKVHAVINHDYSSLFL